VAAAVLMIDGLYAIGPLGSASHGVEPPPDAETLLEDVSAGQHPGLAGDSRPQTELEQSFRDGKRLFVTCGIVSTLAQSMLAEEGVNSRVVTTATRKRFNGLDDGHINNRVAVDEDGGYMGLIEQLEAGDDRRWRTLSDDKLLDFRAAPPGARRVTVDLFIEKGIDAWYDRVLGTPLVETAPGSGEYVFRDPAQQRRIEGSSPAFRLVGQAEWQRHLEG